MIRDVFIIGCKGIPAQYGGFETFVEMLIKNKKSENIRYHVTCLNDNFTTDTFYGAECIKIETKKLGPATALLYDKKALKIVISIIRERNLENPVIYILACRIAGELQRIMKKNKDILFFLNPDGHEFKRSKWNFFIKKYWKYSEKKMVNAADLVICDSKNIESYIIKEYPKTRKTTYIAYGADLNENYSSEKFNTWIKDNQLKLGDYYLMVGRFVPENNYETVISEFIRTKTNKRLVIVSNSIGTKLYDYLIKKYDINSSNKVLFAGTIYDQDLLRGIRINAFAYIHGHEVGGTNPSLLESLALTKRNILLDVGFNKEVALNSALYFTKARDQLSQIINNLEIKDLFKGLNSSKEEIKKRFTWDHIVSQYEILFLEEHK